MKARLSALFIAILPAAALLTAQATTVNVQVSNQIDTSAGIKGRLQVAMSTSFQLAGYSAGFFNSAPGATTPLNALDPFHTRVQVISDGVPLTAPDTWDFTNLDAMMPPIQSTGDHSPEFQIGTAPAFLSNSLGQILPTSYQAFADMSANMVRYYNTGGFTAAGKHYQSPAPYPLTWWGIFNEPDINGVSAAQYVTLYNTVVPEMAKVDPSIKFVALELSANQNLWLPTFTSGVTAPVDVVATHFYSTCDHRTYDQSVFATIPQFANVVQGTIYYWLSLTPKLASVPVWVTENNVNADYDQGNGISACNSPQKFVSDPRGSNAFFAAWRTLDFAYLGGAGTQALYHWSFGGGPQFGELDDNANPQLSYWTDYYLSHWLPSPPGQDILQVTTSGCCATDMAHGWLGSGGLPFDTNTLAARNPDGSVVIMMSNYALQPEAQANAVNYDDNGPGTTRTFALDLSALGSFSSATLITLDAATNPVSGPSPVQMTPSASMTVTIPGYGAAFLRLSNATPVLPSTGVLNAASFAPGAVAPGELVALFGTAIGPKTAAYLALTNPLLVANTLAGVHVLFDGVPAPLIYAGSGQLNTIVPFSVAGKATTRLQVEYLGALSASLTVPVVPAAPGLFTYNGTGQGGGAILNAKNSTVNTATNPAAVGDYISIFGTGAGVTAPVSVDGMLAAPPFPKIGGQVSVTIGGMTANTNYTGAAPSLVAGVMQINAQIPAGVTSGPSVPVVVSINNVPSQSGVTVAVK